ncbi:CAP domain-containing protein [Psychrobacillus sp. NPDC096389]|uniref:CAP domain-containing protein n=1 Tax=Psychrobacillus sp. NPDC096389 TaxID=3364490 RepID=UPI0037F6B65F
MNKNYSLLVGVLAGSLLFSTHSVEASMTTGNSNTTSEAKSHETHTWKSPYQYKYNFNNSQKYSHNASEENEVSEETPAAEKPVTPTQQPSGESNNENVQVSSEIQQVVDLVNSERAKAGLKALQIDTKLTESAQAKSQDMKNKNYFSHTSPTYGSPFDQMKSFGIEYKSAGENIAMGQHGATEVMDAWMKSPGHKANILNPSYTHIGVGLSDSGNYWTQQFIGK